MEGETGAVRVVTVTAKIVMRYDLKEGQERKEFASVEDILVRLND